MKNLIPVIISFLFVPFAGILNFSLAAEIPISDTYSFVDTFSSYAEGSDGSPTWTPVSGTWQVESGEYSQSATAVVYYYTEMRQREFENFTYSAKVKFISGTERDAGICFRWQSGSFNHYVFRFYSNGWYLFDTNGWRTLASGAFTTTTGVWYTLKVEVKGNNIKCYIGDNKVADVNDSTYSKGHIGLYNESCHAHFDDLKLYPPATFTSIIHDYGTNAHPSRIIWNADIPLGSGIGIQLRSADDTPALQNIAWSNEYVYSGSLIGTPKRYIQYMVNIRGNPIFYSVKIEPYPLKSVILDPPPPIKTGTLNFHLYFNEPMNTGIAPSISFTPEGETPISVGGGTWNDSMHFKASYNITSTTGNGFAILQISGAQTFADAYTMPSHGDGNILFIDAVGLAPSTVEFFPNPFSPNGDGKCELSYFVNLPVLNSPTKVIAAIYNLKGRWVRTLFDNEHPAGNISIPAWDGKDDTGNSCPIGVYIYQLKIDATIHAGTVVLTK